ncbi:MAG: DUF2500 domain-containing protein [Erysipelotrichaceae bacterium]|jgi:hypothetical protein
MFFSQWNFALEELIFQILFLGIFILVISIFAVTIYKGLKEKRNNDKSAVLKRRATVVGKRIDVHSFTTYYVTFELDNNIRSEFAVSGEDYGLLANDDYGLLTFQGTRFISFERVV